jgi:hypothetical protein
MSCFLSPRTIWSYRTAPVSTTGDRDSHPCLASRNEEKNAMNESYRLCDHVTGVRNSEMI